MLVDKLNSISVSQAEQESQIMISYSAKRENYLDVKNNEIDKKLINKILNERMKGKPLAKIIKEKGFWKKIFYTDDYTLDPRADSEIIVEQLLIDYEKYKDKDKLRFLDLCCGTGCLGISIIDEFNTPKTSASEYKDLITKLTTDRPDYSSDYLRDLENDVLFPKGPEEESAGDEEIEEGEGEGRREDMECAWASTSQSRNVGI